MLGTVPLPQTPAPCRSAAPSEAHASLVVDALWGSGLPWAQALALQLFDQALRWVWWQLT